MGALGSERALECGVRNAECGIAGRESLPATRVAVPFRIPHSPFRIDSLLPATPRYLIHHRLTPPWSSPNQGSRGAAGTSRPHRADRRSSPPLWGARVSRGVGARATRTLARSGPGRRGGRDPRGPGGATRDRKSVVEGKRVDLGGRRIIKKTDAIAEQYLAV